MTVLLGLSQQDAVSLQVAAVSCDSVVWLSAVAKSVGGTSFIAAVADDALSVALPARNATTMGVPRQWTMQSTEAHMPTVSKYFRDFGIRFYFHWGCFGQ